MATSCTYFAPEGLFLLQLAEPSSMAEGDTDENVFTRLDVYMGVEIMGIEWPEVRTEITII